MSGLGGVGSGVGGTRGGGGSFLTFGMFAQPPSPTLRGAAQQSHEGQGHDQGLGPGPGQDPSHGHGAALIGLPFPPLMSPQHQQLFQMQVQFQAQLQQQQQMQQLQMQAQAQAQAQAQREDVSGHFPRPYSLLSANVNSAASASGGSLVALDYSGFPGSSALPSPMHVRSASEVPRSTSTQALGAMGGAFAFGSSSALFPQGMITGMLLGPTQVASASASATASSS